MSDAQLGVGVRNRGVENSAVHTKEGGSKVSQSVTLDM